MRQNPHVRICGGPGSATTLVYPTPVGHERLQPHGGRHGIPEPKLEARDRAEIPHRPVRRAIAAQAAAVQCRRDYARTVRVGELSVGRAGQADPGSQVDGFSCGRSGEQPPVAGCDTLEVRTTRLFACHPPPLTSISQPGAVVRAVAA